MTYDILLVEDVKIAQKLALFVLKGLDCRVQLAETGAEALNMAEAAAFHLILMDIGLPDINGITVTEKIRSLSVVNKETPIVALTANDDAEYRELCVNAGMNDFLVKPLTQEGMRQVLIQQVESQLAD